MAQQTQAEIQKIALRYARALLEAAKEQGQFDKVKTEMGQLQRIYLEIPELKSFMANPAIPAAEKEDLLAKQFQKALSPLVGNFLMLLLENDRLELLPEMVQSILDLIHTEEGIATAEVTVPVAISEDLENRLSNTLEKMFGYQKVELNIKVDPAIIAGAIVHIKDKMIDGSYHGKLEMLKRQVG